MLKNSIVTGNTALGALGGGILLGIGFSSIQSSTIYGNSAGNPGEGGGIFALTISLFDRFELINSTISGNDARIGGGLYLFGSGFIDIRNSTITGNTASVTFSDGLVGDLTTRLSFFNSLIADDSCRYLGGIPTSNGFNIEGPFDSCFISAFGDQVAVPDALLTPLGDYGGPTPTHALLPGSPAIDAALDADCPASDQRGIIRPLDGDLDGTASCDVGAYEATAALPAPTEIPTLSVIGRVLLATVFALGATTLLRK